MYRNEQGVAQNYSDECRGLEGDWEPVDDKYNGDESFKNPIIAMRESAEKQQEDEENQRRLEAFNLLNYEEQEYWMKKARNN